MQLLVNTHRQAAGQLDIMDLNTSGSEDESNPLEDWMDLNTSGNEDESIDSCVVVRDPFESPAEKARRILAKQMQLQNNVPNYSLGEFLQDKRDLQLQLEQRQPRYGRLRPGVNDNFYETRKRKNKRR